MDLQTHMDIVMEEIGDTQEDIARRLFMYEYAGMPVNPWCCVMRNYIASTLPDDVLATHRVMVTRRALLIMSKGEVVYRYDFNREQYRFIADFDRGFYRRLIGHGMGMGSIRERIEFRGLHPEVDRPLVRA